METTGMIQAPPNPCDTIAADLGPQVPQALDPKPLPRMRQVQKPCFVLAVL